MFKKKEKDRKEIAQKQGLYMRTPEVYQKYNPPNLQPPPLSTKNIKFSENVG